jgi:hypothetical protein
MSNPLLQAFDDVRNDRLETSEPTAAKTASPASQSDHDAKVESLAKSLLIPAQKSEIQTAANAAVLHVRKAPNAENVAALKAAISNLRSR